MHANDSTERLVTDASRQLRDYERGFIVIVAQAAGHGMTLDDAVRCTGYDYQELRAMAERAGVSL